MQLLRTACAALNQIPMDWEGNLTRARRAIDLARAEGASLILLPELALTGYGCEDQFLGADTAARAADSLAKLLPDTKDVVVAVGLPCSYRNAMFNVVALCADCELLGFYAKQNLAGDGIHYEPRWFRPWEVGALDTVDFQGESVPIGDLTFKVGGVHIGFEVCEDAWVADRPGREYAALGVDIILNPSASHFAFGKQRIRERFVGEGARAFGCAYLYANLMGNESGRIIYDGGALIADGGGEVVARGPRLSFKEVAVTAATLDLELGRLAQARSAGREIHGGDCPREEVIPFDWPAPPSDHAVPAPTLPASPMSKEEEFTRASCLGLFDYMRKSWTRGFVVSLSGGADSAAVACLVKLTFELAHIELGDERLAERLHYIADADGKMPETSELLACIYQATMNSGPVTLNAAKTLAEALGATFDEWDVQAIVDTCTSNVEQTMARDLTWETDDITLQNIQARSRAAGIWMLTNARNALLLTTSNRSEAAVGYATMDGDTSGGLAPVSGIDKAYLREWLRWLESGASDELGIPSISALSAVNAQQPTAELRPPGEGQTDEGDLMPYPVLDAIERWAIRDKRAPKDVLQLAVAHFPDYGADQMKAWVIRFFQLWSRNQWKRERYAPGFHLDDENLDPKTWCRFPILSAGFKAELGEL